MADESRDDAYQSSETSGDLRKIDTIVGKAIDRYKAKHGRFQEIETPYETKEDKMYLLLVDAGAQAVYEGAKDEELESLDRIRSAFLATSFKGLSWNRQVYIWEDLDNQQEGKYKYHLRHTELNDQEMATLQRVTTELGIEKVKENKFDIPGYEPKITRLSTTQVPEVTHLLEDAKSEKDKIPFLYRKINNLSEIGRVKLLMELSDDEYDDFVKYIQNEAQRASDYIEEFPGELPENPEERVRLQSRLQYTPMPRYLIAAGLRREDLNRYPILWDAEFLESDPLFREGDRLPRHDHTGRPLTFVESVKRTKLNHAK